MKAFWIGPVAMIAFLAVGFIFMFRTIRADEHKEAKRRFDYYIQCPQTFYNFSGIKAGRWYSDTFRIEANNKIYLIPATCVIEMAEVESAK